MIETVEDFKEQHRNNYKKAILEIIKNNTNILVDDDIMSLLKKPPLDSMDLIKCKFLDIAKKNKIVLDKEQLEIILNNYREDVIKCCSAIKKTRIDLLSKIVEDIKLEKTTDFIRINKKDFVEINKQIKKIVKKNLNLTIQKNIITKIDNIFVANTDEKAVKRFIDEVSKYLNSTFPKSILENIDFKILVKDTILINSTKEQADRFLFTLANSRLLNDEL